ncbi:SapB/AmfS family lanthipeptide [Micromonospora haikouensis]
MALLDLQGLEMAPADRSGDSSASLLLCGDSGLSVTTCN